MIPGMCEHGCGHEARYQHADGRELCTPCYVNETGGDSPVDCPTCSPSPASTTGDFGAVQDSDSVPSGDSVTLIEQGKAELGDRQSLSSVEVADLLYAALNGIYIEEINGRLCALPETLPDLDGVTREDRCCPACTKHWDRTRAALKAYDDLASTTRGSASPPDRDVSVLEQRLGEAQEKEEQRESSEASKARRVEAAELVVRLSSLRPLIARRNAFTSETIALINDAIACLASTTKPEASPSPESSRPASTDREEGRHV